MGYCTLYTLTLHEATPEQEALILEKLQEMDIIGYAFDEDFKSYDSVTWHNHEEDMVKLSKTFPSVHFELYGIGDNNGDLWTKHFLGGKIQRCMAKITMPPFDPNMLEDPD